MNLQLFRNGLPLPESNFFVGLDKLSLHVSSIRTSGCVGASSENLATMIPNQFAPRPLRPAALVSQIASPSPMQGANVKLPNSSGASIINLAASGGSLQAIKSLLALGADPNQLCDKSGEHSLFRCLWANHDLETYVACCSVLIASGASIHLRNREGQLVSDLATQRGVSLASIETSLS